MTTVDTVNQELKYMMQGAQDIHACARTDTNVTACEFIRDETREIRDLQCTDLVFGTVYHRWRETETDRERGRAGMKKLGAFRTSWKIGLAQWKSLSTISLTLCRLLSVARFCE